jgi:iron(III) transport system substrate-binding protein
MRKPILGLAGATALVLALTGCGGAGAAAGGGAKATEATEAAAVYDEINALSGQERHDRLVKLAEEEGQLNLYTSNTDMDSIVKNFEAKYDINVEATRGNSETVLQKLITEAKSGQTSVDIVETNSGELNVMQQQGFFYDYESEYRDAVREDGQMDGWTADRFNAFVVGWNTDSVDPSELPAEIKDFADPKWDGRITLEIGDVDWFAAVSKYYLAQGMTQEEVDEMWEGIAANASVEKGHSAMGDLLSAGKLQITLSIYQHTVDGAAGENGAPVAWQDGDKHVGPVVTRPNGAGLMADAQNPAAAILFMDFLLTEGQETIVSDYRVGSVEQADDLLEGIETIPVPEDEMLNNLDYWDGKYRALVGG